MPNTPFAARLRKLMRAARVSLQDLADAIDQPVEDLGLVAAGDRLPSPDLAEACDRALDGSGRLRRLARVPQAGVLNVRTPFLLRPPELHGRGVLHGRDDELHALTGALTSTSTPPDSTDRICLLRGPSGIGKTALSIHAAERLKNRFAHGRLYEDLRTYHETDAKGAAAEALDRLLRGLGVAARYIPRTLEDRARLFSEWMTDRSVLLILDGLVSVDQAEHLLPRSATAAVVLIGRDIPPGSPPATLDLTLSPLAEAPALELVNASGRLDLTDPGTLDLVRWLLHRCGTRPLMLRMLGGCVAARGRASLDELDHRLANAAQHHDSVELPDAVDACLAVLPRAYRRTAELLALHPGAHIGCGAAASLLGTSPTEAKAELNSLFSSGVLEHYSENLWQFPEALASHVGSRPLSSLRPAEKAAARRRLFDHYVQSVAAADLHIAPSRHRFPLVRLSDHPTGEQFRDKEEARTWMHRELDNLLPVAAAMYSVAKADTPMQDEALDDDPSANGTKERVGDVIAVETDGIDVACWQFAYAARGYLFESKPWRIWVAIYRLGLGAAYQNQTARLAHGLMLANLGLAVGEFGELDEARRRQNSARWAFEEAGDEYGKTNAIHNEAWLSYYSVRYSEAHNLAMRALRFYRAKKIRHSEAIALDCVARSELALGRLDEATRHFEQALKKGRATFEPADLAQIASHLGETFLRRERFIDAEKAFRRAWKLSLTARSLADEAVALDGLAEVSRKAGNVPDVEHWEAQADRAYVAFGSGDPSWKGNTPDETDISPASTVTAPPPPDVVPLPPHQVTVPEPRVLAIDTDWLSTHGGLTTFNRRLCIALAAAGAEVYCLVAESTAQDRDRAAEQKVRLLQAPRHPDDTAREALMRRPRGLPTEVVPDLVIGHGRITGRIAACQKEDHYPTAARLHFIHMVPEETEWFKPQVTDVGLRAEIRGKLERQLAIDADLVFAVGPKLRDAVAPQLWGHDINVRQVDPGFDGAPTSSGPPPDGTHIVLVSGRLHDKFVKGLDIALGAAGHALDALQQAGRDPFRVVLRGATEGDHAELHAMADNPRLQVAPRAFITDEETLRHELTSASLLLMPSRGEGFGLVGAEAIVAGVPVLVSVDSGLGLLLKRLVPDLAPKFVVPMSGSRPTDQDVWAKRIAEVLTDVPRAFADTAELREKLAAQRTWAKAADDVLQAAGLADATTRSGRRAMSLETLCGPYPSLPEAPR